MTYGSRRRKRSLVLVVGVLLSGLVVAAPAAEARAMRTRNFQMPSKNIGCHIGGGVLRCDILSGLNPEPKKQCDLDWVGLLLRNSHRAIPNCAGDTVYKKGAPVLAYGRRWKSRRITCISRESGLRCDNASGYGFKLSRENWDRFYHP